MLAFKWLVILLFLGLVAREERPQIAEEADFIFRTWRIFRILETIAGGPLHQKLVNEPVFCLRPDQRSFLDLALYRCTDRILFRLHLLHINRHILALFLALFLTGFFRSRYLECNDRSLPAQLDLSVTVLVVLASQEVVPERCQVPQRLDYYIQEAVVL